MEGRRRKRIRWDSTARAAVLFSIAFLLIMAQVVSRSSPRRWSPARKFRFDMAPYHARSSSPSQQIVSSIDEENEENLYGEEKRLVHTGPNPLHN